MGHQNTQKTQANGKLPQKPGTDTVIAAIGYARLGYPVLPLAPGEKRPHGGLVPHGLREASQDLKVIRAWWCSCPECGVGIVAPEEVLVLDVDEPGVWDALRSDYPALEAAPRQRTPKGGVHVFLRLPEGVRLSATTRALEGVDLRGMGRAYVVATPTRLADGRTYTWEVPLVKPAKLPLIPEGLLLRLLPPPSPPREVVVEAASSPRRLRALLEAYAAAVASAPEGTRHNALIRYAVATGGLIPHGLDPREAEEALVAAAMRAGLPEREARDAARWGLKVGEGRPLTLEAPPPEPRNYRAGRVRPHEEGITFQDLLKKAAKAKAETLPALLPELFAGIYKGGLSDTEIESLFLTLKKKTGVRMGALRRDWTRYRATREEEDRKGAAPALTLEDRAAAQELSQDPALLHRAIRALGDLGVVGEEENRGLLYLALLSAKMADPISVLVKGRSSSGKSFLVKTVLTLIPPRGYYELSSMSTKALVYADLDFTHRHLVLYEEDGLNNEEVLYLVRTLLSEGEIRYLTVEKTPQGKMAAREIHRPGPTGLITTLTKGLTKEDNETRTFSLYMDDSKEHTLRVVHALAVRESVGARPKVEVAPWHALYEALPHVEVGVPFAPAIARLLDAKDLPEDLTRLRRDFGRFLTLVKVVALLHHARREERGGRIVATLEDYALAYHLAARPMARSVHTVSPQALTLAVAVREVHEDKLAKGDLPPEDVRVYVKELARRLRWATRTVQKWVEMADAAGLVEVQKDGNRLALRPVEGAPLEESSFRLLPEPERLARELGEGGRYVHPITGETCVLYLPESACALPSKTEENAIQDEENQRARYAHQRARTPEERAPEEEKPRAHSEAPSSSQNSEVRARYAHAPTPAIKEEVEVDL